MFKHPGLALAIIILTICVVYFPSLRHVPRSDQIVYLYEVARQNDWQTLAINDGLMNRWGTYAPGDERLFRPGFYFILGSAKFIFNDNWWMWQAFGIVLHTAVACSLFGLLWAMRPGWGALAGALFFASMFSNMEMVIFSHLNPYMVFVLLMIWTLFHCYRFINSRYQLWWRFPLILLLIITASFIYELGVLFAVVIAMGLMLLRPKQWARCLSLIAVSAIFIRASSVNAGVMNSFTGLNLKPLSWWLWGGLFPDQLKLFFSGRNMLSETWQPSYNPFLSDPVYVLSLVGCGCVIALLLIRNFRIKAWQASNTLIAGVALIMLVVFSSVIAWGRSGLFSVDDIIRQNCHYFYLPWVLLIIMVFGFLKNSVVDKPFHKIILLIAIVTIVVFNGYKLFNTIKFQANASAKTYQLLEAVKQIITDHGDEHDFTFEVPVNFPGNYPYQNQWMAGSTLIDMLYPQFIDHQKPKYRLMIDEQST